MSFEIVWRKPDGLIKRHFGHVTGKEILSANVLAEADLRFDDLHYVINDFLGCSKLTVSPDEMEEIVAIDRAASESNPDIRIAVVATHPDVLAAANSYASHRLSTFTTRLFSSMEEACAWLGVGNTYLGSPDNGIPHPD